MKIYLLLASADNDYTDHLSRVLTSQYADTFEISLCSTPENMSSMCELHNFDVALLAPEFAPYVTPGTAQLALLLWGEDEKLNPAAEELEVLNKYQRISNMISQLLEKYAVVSEASHAMNQNHARITVVWSPCGGSGTTTAALVYAAKLAARGKKTVYLDLENFSSTPVYFQETGKSISSALAKMSGNAALLLRSIRQQDSSSGICYFCHPDNYDDIQALNQDDLSTLVDSCGAEMDELVLDLSSVCDARSRYLMEMAERVLVVVDRKRSSQIKWEQFRTQHDLYSVLAPKMVVVANRTCRGIQTGACPCVELPAISTEDPIAVFRTLSAAHTVSFPD